MSLVCLIGRHGGGKSTLGSMLRRHGFQHYSVGTMRRLARRGELPNDVPVSLMLALRRAPIDESLPEPVVKQILALASRFPHCVLDGFPASPAHIALLPSDAVVLYIYSDKRTRLQRLASRAEQTQRNWHFDRTSSREAALAAVTGKLRADGRLTFIRNCGDLAALHAFATEFAKRVGLAPRLHRNQPE